MNNSNFIRKIIYLVAIGVLLVPLSMVSRPASLSKSGTSSTGGRLATLRDKYELSQSKLMEIDPASETMKLASLGLRGVAINMLWMQAMEQKKKDNYDQLASTLQMLTKIQPNFVKVWEYQAHNMAYNISMEFDDYESRYHWVKKGISFLKDGIPYNRSDPRMKEHLGFYTGLKIGRSDEKVQFRRMFREDTEFHQLMEEYIEPDSYDTREYGHDNWKMAYYWYDLAVKMVDDAGLDKLTSDARFYMLRPAQLRNQGLSLGSEFRTGDVIQDVWRLASDQWMVYGRQEIRNSFGVDITMQGLAEYQVELDRLEDELDALAPAGLRDEYMAEIFEKIDIPEIELAALEIPADQRTDEEFVHATRATMRISQEDRGINLMIFKQVSPENERQAKRVFDEIAHKKTQIGVVGTQDSVTNYRYWVTRTRAEASELMVIARQSLFDAQELARESIFDDEYEFNYETKEKTIIRIGAIHQYEDAFRKFMVVLDEYPMLRSGELADTLVDSLVRYKGLLDMSGMDWPEKDFPMQILIDQRANGDDEDVGLPTTEMLEERRSGREEEADENADGDAEPVAPKPDAEPTAEKSEKDDASATGDAEKSESEKGDAESEDDN